PEPARPPDEQDPTRLPSADRPGMAHLPELRLRPRPVRRHRRVEPLAVHPRVRGPSTSIRLVPRQPPGAIAPPTVRVRSPGHYAYRPLKTRADGASARRPRGGLGRSEDADACGCADAACLPRRCAGSYAASESRRPTARSTTAS